MFRCLLALALSTSILRAAPPKAVPGSGLSLHDKVAQMIMVRGYGDFPAPSNAEFRRFRRWIEVDHVGGFIVAGRIVNGSVIPAQPYEMVTFINRMQKLAKTPLLIGSDFERGASARVAGTPRFPYLMAFGATHNLADMKALGAATAHEARALGVTWVFAPDADVNNNPDNPIINTRSYSEDPQAVAQGISAFIEGAHAPAPGRPILVTAKHFPGHGDTAEDSHLQVAKLAQPKERLESLELVPFRAAVESHVDAIMTAHLSVPAIEPDGRPATVSKSVLTGLLRDELNFEGLVVTDALEMQGITSMFSQGEAAVRTVEAGADVLLMPLDPEACIRGILAAIDSGRLSRARVEKSVAKIMDAKRRTGLLSNRFTDLGALNEELAGPKYVALAQSVADRSFTLVKDEKQLFPVPAGAKPCLVVMGESQFTTRGEIMTVELRRTLKDLKVYVVTPAVSDPVLTAVAADASAQCSHIYAAAFITVSASRGSVALEGGLSQFLNNLIHGTAPVALISFGNPYLLRDFKDVAAYAATFSTTQTSEIAAAKAVAGKIAITGRLPVSIPGLAKIGDGLDVPARVETASK